METNLHEIGSVTDELLHYAVICAFVGKQLVLVRNRQRVTWEIPGGRRELGEAIDATASRELQEETGAIRYEMEQICDYSVTINGNTSFGRLYYANIEDMEQELHFEVGEVMLSDSLPPELKLTYPEIQPLLYRTAITHKNRV
ncbi:MAG TPA: NUDIX domain-containing protein [Williamwhitmania sp.]|nr:NUDIX domain-containing protein [Williamwhitmania sp.]